jgi:hypothetical protein
LAGREVSQYVVAGVLLAIGVGLYLLSAFLERGGGIDTTAAQG